MHGEVNVSNCKIADDRMSQQSRENTVEDFVVPKGMQLAGFTALHEVRFQKGYCILK